MRRIGQNLSRIRINLFRVVSRENSRRDELPPEDGDGKLKDGKQDKRVLKSDPFEGERQHAQGDHNEAKVEGPALPAKGLESSSYAEYP
jgi:hypothetical protein